MNNSNTLQKPVRSIKIPATLQSRIENRNEQIEQLNKQLQHLRTLNQESMTSFLEGQKIPKNREVKFNQETWSIEIFKKSGDRNSEKSSK